MGKTALVIGATGLTGTALVKLLIADTDFESVKIFGRKSTNLIHPKITEYIVDLFNPLSFENDFTGDVAFCCIGTTAKKTPDKDLYRQIDFGIPVTTTQLCKKNNIPQLLIISALGANKESTVFYNRIKGKMEEAVLSQELEKLHLLQPSLIEGNRNEFRLGEKIASIVMSIGKLFLLGSLKKYQPIQAIQIARAMVYLSKHPFVTTRIESDEIKKLSDAYN
mgnify:FL=1